jgi:hypothetical protein
MVDTKSICMTTRYNDYMMVETDIKSIYFDLRRCCFDLCMLYDKMWGDWNAVQN